MKTYTAPVLRVHGKLEDLTKGNASGNYIDIAFTAGTPVSSLTFS